jgi:hypothetical protein
MFQRCKQFNLFALRCGCEGDLQFKCSKLVKPTEMLIASTVTRALLLKFIVCSFVISAMFIVK